MNKLGGYHLLKEERNTIQEQLALNKSCKEIADLLNKNDRTISKEIKNRRTKKKNGRYIYNKFKTECKIVNRFPYVCNGCDRRKYCNNEYYYYYDADTAQMNYKTILSSTREGINMTLEEKIEFDTILKNGIDKGQSPYHIINNNKENVHCSLRTAYRIIDKGETIVQNIDLRRKCKLKPRKSYKKTKDKSKVREGRSYIDFLNYFGENPSIGIVEIDTVEGPKDGNINKCLLTIHFTASHFMLAFLLESKTKNEVSKVFIYLQNILGKQLYSKLFNIILTDRGEEFLDPLTIETFQEDGEIVSRVFFCNSYSSYQKGAIEENHTLIRYVIPKGTSMNHLNQDKIDLLMSHINSYARNSVSSSPYFLFSALYGSETLKKVRISKIDPNSVTLNQSLLK